MMWAPLVLFVIQYVSANIEDNIFLQGVLNPNKKPVTGHAQTETPKCELGGFYSIAHEEFCDKFYLCSNGNPYVRDCLDGTAFVPHIGCKPIAEVDCSDRPKIRDPPGSCIRPNGRFPHKNARDCQRYVECRNGKPANKICPGKKIFDLIHERCRKADSDEYDACFGEPTTTHEPFTPKPKPQLPHKPATPKPVSVLPEFHEPSSLVEYMINFKCPDPEYAVYPFGTHSRHPIPGNCRYFLMCLLDGTKKISGCRSTEAFNPANGDCIPRDHTSRCKAPTTFITLA